MPFGTTIVDLVGSNDSEKRARLNDHFNNKIIVKMADGVKRARLDGDKEIYLAELLGVNIADAHTTVNEVLRSSGMPTWRIADKHSNDDVDCFKPGKQTPVV